MDLKHLTDSQLLKDTAALAEAERSISTKLLHHLKEIDKRKLFSDLKCTSLHDYCVRVLKLSEADAQRKIQSARLLADMPELEIKIKKGSLTLTNLAKVATFFNQQEIKSVEEKKEILQQVEDLTKKECERRLFQIAGTEVTEKESLKRVSQNSLKFSLIITDETFEKLERLKALLGKKLSMQALINLMADQMIESTERKKFKTGSKKSPPPVAVTERYIPNATKKAVYERDKKCQNCGSLQHLNYDHRKPFALGGDSSESNLRLLCFQCNQRGRIRAKL